MCGPGEMLPQAELGLRMSPRGMRTFRQLSKKASPIFWCYKDGLFESLEGSTHRSSDGSPGPFPRPQSPLGEDAGILDEHHEGHKAAERSMWGQQRDRT